MTNEQAEKHWQELVEKEMSVYTTYCYCAGPTCSGCENNTQKLIKYGIKFVRANLSQLPEVREAIGVIEAFKVYFETLNEGRHGYAQDKMRGQINDALKKLGGGE